jgi:hypothetical protein
LLAQQIRLLAHGGGCCFMKYSTAQPTKKLTPEAHMAKTATVDCQLGMPSANIIIIFLPPDSR